MRRISSSIRKRIGSRNKIKAYNNSIDSEFIQHLGTPTLKKDGSVAVVSYFKDGNLDLQTYKDIQQAANDLYLNDQWVGEDHIREMAQLVVELAEPPLSFGICHGTRRGNEQRWFREYIGRNIRVIGTEISDSASNFPDTVQMDFHTRNLDWIGKANFVYSNAWDHSYDPRLAFSVWIESLAPGGLLILDWSDGHSADAVTVVDPFGISRNELVGLLNKEFADLGEVVEVRPGGKHRYMQIFGIAFKRKIT